VATTVVVVTIEIARRVTRELLRATIREDPLPGTRDLNIETMIPTDVVADVADLNHHCLTSQVGVGPAPVIATRVMLLIQEAELEALAAIIVSMQAADTTDGSRCEAHTQATVYDEGLVVCTARGTAPITH
jgi:hypothetical protein